MSGFLNRQLLELLEGVKRWLHPFWLLPWSVGIPLLSYAVVYGVENLPEAFWRNTFPFSLVMVAVIVLAQLLGLFVPIGCFFWGLLTVVLKIEGKRRHVGFSLLLVVVSFIAAGMFVESLEALGY